MKKPKTKAEMIKYLAEHPRYHTMNSWNNATTYATYVKIRNISQGLPDDVIDRMHACLEIEEAFEDSKAVMDAFEAQYNHEWQIGQNGRSGGYLVLLKGGAEPSGYKSHCINCGRRCFRRVLPDAVTKDDTPEGVAFRYMLSHNMWVPEIYPDQPEIKALGLSRDKILELSRKAKDDIKEHGDITLGGCGCCGGRLQNFTKPHMRVFTRPGLGTDMDEDYSTWDIASLRYRVDIVWDFDQTCQEVISSFIQFAKTHKVIDDTILVEKKIKRAVPLEDNA